MLRVLIEFVPDDDGVGEQRELACAEIRAAGIDDMVGNYSLVVREGPNPLADSQPWAAAGEILNHNRAQTVWALAEKICLFGLMAASHQGHATDSVKICGRRESFQNPTRGCPKCDGIIGEQWKFCAFCGEKIDA